MTAAPRPATRAPHATPTQARGFWGIAVTFMITMAYTTIPTPLYAIYQERDGFPTWMITVVFAAYAVGVAVSLYLAGHVSDWLGRRRILLAALAIEIASAVMFIAWNDPAGLIAARFVSGLGIGALTATASAYLAELRAASRPEPNDAGVVSNFANIGGLALGPLVAGVLVTVLPWPLVVPYAAFAITLVALAVVVVRTPETVTPAHRPYRPQRVAVPAHARTQFWAAGAGAFAGFAVFGFVMALTPTVLGASMGVTSRLAAGAVPFAVFMSAAVTQVLTVRMTLAGQLRLSWALATAGVAALAVAVPLGALVLYVVAGIVAGAGVGILFRASLGVAASLAPAGAKGEVLAAMFLIAYVGLAIPTLAIGAALVWFPLGGVLVAFAAVVLVVWAVAVPRMLTRLAG